MPRKRLGSPGRGGSVPPDGRPAKVAGPTRFSTRTDLSKPAGTQPVAQPGGLGYTQGTVKQMEDAQRVLPLQQAGTGVPRPSIGPMPKGGYEQHLMAPSNHPDEPLTAGSENLTQQAEQDLSVLKDWVPALNAIAQLPGADPALTELANRARTYFGL